MPKPKGSLTAGIEKEFSGLRLRSDTALADHTLLFTTPNVAWKFETQARGRRKKGTIEAIQTIASAEGNRIRAAALEVSAVKAVMTECVGQSLLEFQVRANQELERVRATWRIGEVLQPTLEIVRNQKKKNKTSPQMTVTHELRLVHSIFEKGATHGSWKEARSRIMKRAAHGAAWITQNHPPTKQDGVTRRDAAKIKGYLTLLCQDVIVTIARSDDESPFYVDCHWTKDDFGLLPKTPLLTIFDRCLSARDKEYLTANRDAIYRFICAQQTDRGRLIEPPDDDDPPDPRGVQLGQYIVAALGGPRGAMTPKGVWQTLLGDDGTTEIVHFDPTLQRPRVAFEYRALHGREDVREDLERTVTIHQAIQELSDAAYADYSRRHEKSVLQLLGW